MSALRRIRVISEGGRLIGIFAAYPAATARGGPSAELHAGPGQREHEIDVEWPSEREPGAIVKALHTIARKTLQLQ